MCLQSFSNPKLLFIIILGEKGKYNAIHHLRSLSVNCVITSSRYLSLSFHLKFQTLWLIGYHFRTQELDRLLCFVSKMQTRTVHVGHLSDLATEREIHEFFSFSGDIEHVEICRDSEQKKTAFVTFKDPRALEIALLLSVIPQFNFPPIIEVPRYGVYLHAKDNKPGHEQPGWSHDLPIRQGATIVDQIVSITPVENYVPKPEFREVRVVDNAVSMAPENHSPNAEGNGTSPRSGRVYMSKAQDVVSSVLAKGSAIRQDAVNKAKAFDEKHQLRANASARVNSFDKRVGLTEKLSVGVSVVNEKVKSVDQRLQVSDKTMAALLAAERKLNDTGSAVKSSRFVELPCPLLVFLYFLLFFSVTCSMFLYVTAGSAWLNGAFGKVAKAGQVAGTKTRQKWNLAVSNLTAKDSPIAA
ncbi:Nucleotide-binding, alpha-beta plait [Cynara cardunculus var. scolymus]|uniref:Nucleotide-binding, alpha-beta plait n=1 Tax=Cynara cardunculus var. scolymus TaxID=59895 RepID=A0A103YI45_CYNCS|nr:Nucleotide-binding, alpha-beta plait [Cynara cardunculus var. scolymus]